MVSPLFKKKSSNEISFGHSDLLETTDHIPIHQNFIIFQFLKLPRKNNVVI